MIISEAAPRVVEWFAGIGGCHQAWPEAEYVAAVDIDQDAASVYRANFASEYQVAEIQSLSSPRLQQLAAADLWWLSPPCQPYSRRGSQRDIDDPRAASLLRLIDFLAAGGPHLPAALAVENVVGFERSIARERLLAALHAGGYFVAECQLCPTQFAWPNRRPRYYLLASQQPLPAWRANPDYAVSLRDVVSGQCQQSWLAAQPGKAMLADIEPDEDSLWLPDEQAATSISSLDWVALDAAPGDASAGVTACFAGSYGKTLRHSGSYVRQQQRLRRFAPREVARLLGFPDSFRLPGLLGRRRQWKLLGNSLSLPAVRYVLSHLSASCDPRLPWCNPQQSHPK